MKVSQWFTFIENTSHALNLGKVFRDCLLCDADRASFAASSKTSMGDEAVVAQCVDERFTDPDFFRDFNDRHKYPLLLDFLSLSAKFIERSTKSRNNHLLQDADGAMPGGLLNSVLLLF